MAAGSKPKNLKEANLRLSLEVLRPRESVSVAELSRELSLSKTTAKKLLDLLVREGIALSLGKGESTNEGGKKPELFGLNPRYGYVAAIHVTPDSVLSAAADLRGDIADFRKVALGAARDLPAVIGRIAAAVADLAAAKAATGQRLIAVAVSLPGLVDSDRGVSIYSPHYPEWGREVPFLALLRDALAGTVGEAVPIFVDCVNRHQALAERTKGVARGYSDFVIIDALEEGLGSGVYADGKLRKGAQSLSGEIGHMILDAEAGPVCICGARGCFEALVSAKRMTAMARGAYSEERGSALFADRSPEEVSLADICVRAGEGDGLCRTLVADAAKWFVLGIGNLVMVNDPSLVVIQGQYALAGGYFLDLLRDGLKRIGLPDVEKRTRIEYSVMGDERGLLGGAAFAVEDFFSRGLRF